MKRKIDIHTRIASRKWIDGPKEFALAEQNLSVQLTYTTEWINALSNRQIQAEWF